MGSHSSRAAGSQGAGERRRRPRSTPRPLAVLYPAIVAAARWAGAGTVGLVDVSATGLNLVVDRAAIDYGGGREAGDPASPLRVRCRLVGGSPVPTGPFPEVAARVVVDTEPLDPTRAEDGHALRALLPPDDREGIARLEAELALAEAAPPHPVRGHVLEALPEALAAVPSEALPMVITTWALSRLRPHARPRFLDRLREAGGRVAWVSVEGVGVAPGVPTLGDRPASGHSIVGLALCDPQGVRVTAAGRCWQRGAVLEWLLEG